MLFKPALLSHSRISERARSYIETLLPIAEEHPNHQHDRERNQSRSNMERVWIILHSNSPRGAEASVILPLPAQAVHLTG